METIHRFTARNSTSTKIETCSVCDHILEDRESPTVHFRDQHAPGADNLGICPICNEEYRSFARHARSHFNVGFKCSVCERMFPTKEKAFVHFRNSHSLPESGYFSSIDSAFQKTVETFSHKFKGPKIETFDELYHHVQPEILEVIQHQLRIKPALRYSVIVFARYVKKVSEEAEIREECVMPLKTARSDLVLRGHKKRTIRREVQRSLHVLEVRNEQVLLSGSGWTLDHFVAMNIEVGRVGNAADFVGNASSAGPFLKKLKSKGLRKYVTHIPSERDDCFFNAVAAGLIDRPPTKSTVSEAERLLITGFVRTQFKWRSFDAGMRLTEVRDFEKRNRRLNFGVNVFMLDEGRYPYIVYQPKNVKAKKGLKIVNVLLLSRQTNKMRSESHFMYINDLNNISGHQKFPCDLCMNVFSRKSALKKHRELCMTNSPQLTVVPKPGALLKFENKKNTVLHPIFGTLDFEACMHAAPEEDAESDLSEDEDDDGGEPSQKRKKTRKINTQVPATYSLYLQDTRGNVLLNETKSSDGLLLNLLFHSLNRIETEIYPLLNRCPNAVMSEEDENMFQSQIECYLCNKSFLSAEELETLEDYEKTNLRKVRDHCHYYGTFIAAAHNECNILRRWREKITIFVHNLKNYDSHFLMQGIKYTWRQVSGIPLNTEKFKSLSIGNIQFTDSMQLLPSSLAGLVDNLRNSNYSFPSLTKLTSSQEERDLLLRKGVFPYEWFTSVAQLKHATQLPEKVAFFSCLTQENISDSDYAHAQKVFRFFKCKNMLDYTELYCQLDTILLFEVVQAFRADTFTSFGLDCTRYISTPQLSFDCMLRSLDEPIELMSDLDMILLCENNIRGGVSFVNERLVKPESESEHLLYIDANNLYSVAQNSPLPVGEFSWCNASEIAEITRNILSYEINNDYGYILEVDLTYPKKLHDLHASLPLAAEHVKFTYQDLSPYSQASMRTLRGHTAARGYKASKLCTTLRDKKKYVCHYRNLQTYLRNGLKLKKVHRIIRFRQKPFVRKYIQKCTRMRAMSNSEFDKLVNKLRMNACFGKFLQNARNFLQAFLCRKEKTFSKHYNSENYRSHKILAENLALVFTNMAHIVLDKPFVTGFSILEIAKDHMNRAFHEFIQPVLGAENVSVVLTDTDSFILHVKNMSRDEMLNRLSPIMDYSNYPSDHERYHTRFKAIPGYFKDEHQSKTMERVVALRSKCYAIEMKESEKLVCKGITKAAKKELSVNAYAECVVNFKEIATNMYNIRSFNHVIHTQKMSRIALTSTDDKRYLLPCGRHSLPHGHYQISSAPSCSICPMSIQSLPPSN